MYDIKILSIVHLILSVVYLSVSSPLPAGHVKFDQRQEGEWNVRADLENFVVLIIPAGGPAGGFGGLGLLDLLRKAPNKSVFKSQSVRKQTIESQLQEESEIDENLNGASQEILLENQSSQEASPGAALETQHFIESKTAPYRVDISKLRDNLAKLHPQFQRNEGLLIAHSPSLSLLKNSDGLSTEDLNKLNERMAKAFVITIPISESKTSKTKQKHNKHKELKEAEKWHLLGDGLEDCGPGMKRDSQGICRTIPQ